MSKPLPLPGWPRGMKKPLAAAYIGQSERSLDRLLAAKQLTARREGKKLVFLKDDLDAFLDAMPVAQSTDVPRPGD